MRNKRRIYLVVYHRGSHSLGPENARKLGQSIFHWAILIRPKKWSSPCDIFDATDFVHQASNGDLLTPLGEWWFRARHDQDPISDYRFLGGTMIGKMPGQMTVNGIHAKLKSVSLPRVGYKATENCLSWAKAAVDLLQRDGVLEKFDLDELCRQTVALGHDVLVKSKLKGLRHVDRWRNASKPSS